MLPQLCSQTNKQYKVYRVVIWTELGSLRDWRFTVRTRTLDYQCVHRTVQSSVLPLNYLFASVSCGLDLRFTQFPKTDEQNLETTPSLYLYHLLTDASTSIFLLLREPRIKSSLLFCTDLKYSRFTNISKWFSLLLKTIFAWLCIEFENSFDLCYKFIANTMICFMLIV